ncbi:MAG: trypsin-like peptidase domain-containing protein [Rubrivivax sp.]|nr:trypsin-like peptidase domain-containing protein [Rubrivivax sp.]
MVFEPTAIVSRRTWLALVALGVHRVGQAGLVETVAVVRQSVVAVGTYAETDAPRFGFRGTGFIVGDGTLLVTNHHVLPSAEAQAAGPAQRVLAALVPKPGGEPELRRARLVGSDRNHDLALLRIEGGPLPPLTLGSSELAPQGSSIALIGFPIGGVFGFTPVVHRGIVAAVSRVALPASDARQLNPATVARLRDGPFEVYQLDATAYPGNSGGPLIDAESGQVIGVVNMVLVRSTRESALTNPTGITYAIPVRRVLDLLKSSGG